MLIQEIVDAFEFDPDLLEKDLCLIKQRYEKRRKAYKSYLSEAKVNALTNNICKRAKELACLLDSMPMDVKETLNSLCPRQIPTTTTEKKGGPEENSDVDDFINDTMSRLESIERVTSALDIHTFGENKMHHKDSLVRDFRDSWEKLSGVPPSRSSKKNHFIEFMDWACEYMEINNKGLSRKHLNTD
jgi:hypothetical protein